MKTKLVKETIERTFWMDKIIKNIKYGNNTSK